ncbi:MAG TPA: type II toxin-antitoxin system PemK/MazF family toxin [Bryobacteraceae bacterium]
MFQRGDVVLAVLTGDYGKPRPAIVVQSNLFNSGHASIVLCPASSDLTGLLLFRIPIVASEATGLVKDSEVMVDKILAAKRERIRRKIGRLSPLQMASVDRALRIWLELPDESTENNP